MKKSIMIIKTDVDAPDLNALIDKPFNYERGSFGSSANAVEHEHQQDIEFALFGVFLDKLDLVSVVGADLEARYAVFLRLVHDSPAHPFRKLATGFSLHGDIRLVLLIVVDLFRC